MKKSRSKKQKFRVRWHQSAVVQAASLVSLILICAYTASIVITAQGFDAIASIAHRVDVEKSFSSHLDRIKEVHSLKQRTLSMRLENLASSKLQGSVDEISRDELDQWLSDAGVEMFAPLKEVQLSAYQGEPSGPKIAWQGKQKLRIFNYLLTFPRGETYKDFVKTEGIQKRYRVIGTQLDGEIKPALIKANALVLLLAFLLLITAFLIIARRFNQKVEKLIGGISYWSEVDHRFRFGSDFSGELQLICQQFNRMADEVEENRQKRLYMEKVASWQTIARKLAHEIKNPLTPIQMMITQLAKGYTGDDQKFKQLLENSRTIITEEVDSLRRMVDHFSRFARLPEPKFESTNIVDLAQKIVNLEAPAFPQHQIYMQETIDEAFARVDPDLIKQVLINLIKNAAEASGETGSEIKISVIQQAHFLHLAVTDNGPGIPKEMQNKIFEAYYTTKHTGPSPGMGLGLAVCQKILLDHSGEITVKSKPGSTTFTMILPKEKEDQ